MIGKVLSPEEFANEMRGDDRLVAMANLMADQLEALGFGEAISVFRGGPPEVRRIVRDHLGRVYACSDTELDAYIEAIISRRVDTLRDLAHVQEERFARIDQQLDDHKERLNAQCARADRHEAMINAIAGSFQSEAAVIRIVKAEIDRFRQRTNEVLKSGDGKLCDALNEFHERLSRLEGTAKS